jgi:DNA-binding PucR family transcriptional regulator
VLDDLGATLLDMVHGVPNSADEIGGVVIHDPVDVPVLPPNALVLGVGPVADDLAGLAHALACTNRALRVPREGRGARRVARLEGIQVEGLMLELRDLVAARGNRPTGSLARLIEYDQKHQSNLVETLRAWLDAFGEVTAASEALFLHPNTFRYRLRRVTDVGQINLADPEQRFVAMLQLRVLGRAPSAEVE